MYRLTDNLTTNKKFITNLVDNYKKQISVSNPDINKTHISCINLCRGILVLLENTDAKKGFINGYNARLKSSISTGREKLKKVMDPSEYYDVKKSDDYENIKYVFKKNEDGTITYKDKSEQMLEQNMNKDVVIEGFRKAIHPDKSGKYNFEFSKIYCADMLNRMAHHIIDDQKQIKQTIYFKEGPLNTKGFEDKLSAIETLKDSCAENYFETANVSNYLKDPQKNAKCKRDYDAFSKALKNIFPKQTINKKFIASMNECYNDKELIDILFEGKSLAVGDLWISQNKIKKHCEAKGKDPYDEKKLFYRTDLVEDDRLTPKEEKTYRIAICLQSEYDDLIKFNNGYVYSPNYTEYLANKYQTTIEEMNAFLNKTSKKLNMPEVSDLEDNAIKDQVNMTSFHLTQDFVNKYKGKYDLSFLKETNCAYLKRTAFRSSNLLVPYSNKKSAHIADLNNLSDIANNCMDCEEKYVDPEKMYNRYDLEKYVVKEFASRQKGGN